jgi:hypothetical protein
MGILNFLNFFKINKWTDSIFLDVLSTLEKHHELGYTLSKSINLISQDKKIGRSARAIKNKLKKHDDFYVVRGLNHKDLLWGTHFKQREKAAIEKTKTIVTKQNIKEEKLKTIEVKDVVINEIVKDIKIIEEHKVNKVKKWTQDEVDSLAYLLKDKKSQGFSFGKSLSIINAENENKTNRSVDAMRHKLKTYSGFYVTSVGNSRGLLWGTYFEDDKIEIQTSKKEQKKELIDISVVEIEEKKHLADSSVLKDIKSEISPSVRQHVSLGLKVWNQEKFVTLGNITVELFEKENIQKEQIVDKAIFFMITQRFNAYYGTEFDTNLIISKLRLKLKLCFKKVQNTDKYIIKGNYQDKNEICRTFRKYSKPPEYILTEGCESI